VGSPTARHRVPVPEAVAASARAAASGLSAPEVEARDAATVVLLREGADGPEVYLLRRHASMAFAPGQAVFPGGGVDPRDRDAEVGWVGPDAVAWGERFATDPTTARGLVCAAVRETFEEAGVLLAGPDAGTVVADTTGDAWEADRRALESRDLSLAGLLRRRGLLLRSDLLAAWAHWITPAFEPRRYDTRFFVAVLPPGQRTRDVSGESDAVAWLRPGDAIEAVREGRLAMMPPTLRTCADLVALPRAGDALAAAAARRISTVQPRLVVDGDQMWLETDPDTSPLTGPGTGSGAGTGREGP
jgi:8-oxo-dGTP pyrophosphatase MutT (NUDIX family)